MKPHTCAALPRIAVFASQVKRIIRQHRLPSSSHRTRRCRGGRFPAISVATTGRDRTSLIFTVADTPGALFGLLKPFAERGINLTKIESRPEKTEAWKYVFFVDIEGHVDDEPVRQTLEEARRYTQRLKVLGSYPRVD